MASMTAHLPFWRTIIYRPWPDRTHTYAL